MADEVLLQGVQGITDLITTPGLINLDFADVKAVMTDAGSSLMGIGQARGEDRASEAAKAAISSPLLEASIEGALGVLLNIAGGSDLGLFEVNEAANIISTAAHPDANIIFGAVVDDTLGDEVRDDGDRRRLRPVGTARGRGARQARGRDLLPDGGGRVRVCLRGRSQPGPPRVRRRRGRPRYPVVPPQRITTRDTFPIDGAFGPRLSRPALALSGPHADYPPNGPTPEPLGHPNDTAHPPRHRSRSSTGTAC